MSRLVPPHPDIIRWADYVRGAVGEAEQAGLRRHLESGCRRCARRHAALERMAAVARADAPLTPPAAVLRSIKALPELRSPRQRSRLAARLLVLRRDSALAPAPAGTRSSDSPGRHLLFDSGAWTLDLSVEPTEEAAVVALTGSCLRRGGEPLAGAAVLAATGGGIAGGAETDDVGEFLFDRLPAEPCELWLFAAAGRPLMAELDLARCPPVTPPRAS